MWLTLQPKIFLCTSLLWCYYSQNSTQTLCRGSVWCYCSSPLFLYTRCEMVMRKGWDSSQTFSNFNSCRQEPNLISRSSLKLLCRSQYAFKSTKKNPSNSYLRIGFIWEMFPLGWKVWSTFSSSFYINPRPPPSFSALSGTFHTDCC